MGGTRKQPFVCRPRCRDTSSDNGPIESEFALTHLAVSGLRFSGCAARADVNSASRAAVVLCKYPRAEKCLFVRVVLHSIFFFFLHVLLFRSTDRSKHFTILATFTHSYADGRGCHARRRLLIRSSLGFSILLQDTSTCSWGEPGFEPSNLPITRRPALPAELQLPQCALASVICLDILHGTFKQYISCQAQKQQ